MGSNRGVVPTITTMIRNILQSPLSLIIGRRVGTHGRTRVTSILSEQVKLLSHRKPPCGFRTLCTDRDFSFRKCVPCDLKTLQPMTAEEANNLRSKVPEWDLLNEGGILKLSGTWKVKSFSRGIELFQIVAVLAEAEGHHPDLHLIGWNNVKIEIWTHAVGGLTENDFILASKISELKLQQLLKRNLTDQPSNI